MSCNSTCFKKEMKKIRSQGLLDNPTPGGVEEQAAVSKCTPLAADLTDGSGYISPYADGNAMTGPDFSSTSRLQEGFRSCLPGGKKLLKWLIIGLIIYLVLSMIMDTQRQDISYTIAPLMGGAMSASPFNILQDLNLELTAN